MPDQKTPKKILCLKDVIEKTGRSYTSLWRDMKNKRFPSTFKTGIKSVGILESDVDEWIDNQKNGVIKTYD